jgi:hypothetical protein
MQLIPIKFTNRSIGKIVIGMIVTGGVIGNQKKNFILNENET